MARTITTGGNWSLDQGPDTKLPILTQVDSIYTIVPGVTPRHEQLYNFN